MTWVVERAPKFERGYVGLSSEAQRHCDDVVNELANADDPRKLGERLSGLPYFKYRFGGVLSQKYFRLETLPNWHGDASY